MRGIGLESSQDRGDQPGAERALKDPGPLLVVRRRGHLWGVLHRAVGQVQRHHQGFRLAVEPEDLVADQVVAIVEDIAIYPAGGVLGRFWGEAASGLALYGETPLVVVDPHRPPSWLKLEDRDGTGEGESSHGE